MADIDLYLDPVCPFARVTSRWRLAASTGGHGFNGPVLTESPTTQRGPALPDALGTAAASPEFAASHRPYQGPPLIETTTGAAH